jgi:hypothetical protein
MTKRYYSSRVKRKTLTLEELYWKLQHLFLLFRNKDYFKEKAGITETGIPDFIEHEAAIALTFQPFPITKWAQEIITEDHIFDVLEFLYEHVSRPGAMEEMTSETGWNYSDYDSYDSDAGRSEFREKLNSFLCDYRTGYELMKDGTILAIGSQGLQHILDAEILPYDEANVDSKVRNAITKWRNRHLSFAEKKEAVREMADVFEWLKKTKGLDKVLDGKDESALFDIANNFSIRHHDPKQKSNYDKNIWYAWMFHFYLATYHAAIRLLAKAEKQQNQPERKHASK